MSGIYAIDFGTSNTVVSRWNVATQSAETMSFPILSCSLGNGISVVPSVLYVENASIPSLVVGQAVRDRGFDVTTNPRFFRTIKRGIGLSSQGFLPTLDNKAISFEQVGRWFLSSIIRSLQAQESNTIDSLTLTVPVNSFEHYRNWLADLMPSFNIHQIRMLDEPTAAALGYEAEGCNTLLVVDCGGGTIDFSLVQLSSAKRISEALPTGYFLKVGEKNLAKSAAQKIDTAKVLAKVGQNLGGADIDNWMLEHFAEEQGAPMTPLTLRLAEKLKISLSSEEIATEAFFNDETLETYEFSMDRETLKGLLETRGFFKQLDDAMSQVLRQGRQQGIEQDDIDAVLLVGGTAQIPSVQNWVSSYFSKDKIRSNNPFGAVAQGALNLSSETELQDFLYHGYGIRYWNRRDNRHDWHPIISEGQPYPMKAPIELVLGASVAGQPSIELVIGELGSVKTSTEVYFDGDRLITRTISGTGTQVQPLNDAEGARSLATLDPLGSPGRDRIKLLFRVDTDRFLRVTIEDLLTRERLIDNKAVVQLT